MKALAKLSLLLTIFSLVLALTGAVRVHAAEGDMKTFLDSEAPGIRIQVNATTQTRPTGNLTVMLSLTTQTGVYIEHFNLELFGFLNGTTKLSMVNVTDNEFPLNNTSKQYNCTVNVPDWVWGIIYGEIRLTYSASLGSLELRFPNVATGFPMTQVENTFLEDLEVQVRSLNENYNRLTSVYENLTNNFAQLNQSYWALNQNYTSVQGSLGELDNTRRLITVLAVTTIFFLATTIYLVMRKPREYW
jgi:hypothetical protein